ncbi:MAG: hypothetical protein FWG74_02055, partial [Planctomycetes bacterium]|nr:hypothetical protein [Planctomycetota bacterium]
WPDGIHTRWMTASRFRSDSSLSPLLPREPALLGRNRPGRPLLDIRVFLTCYRPRIWNKNSRHYKAFVIARRGAPRQSRTVGGNL